MKKAFVVLLCIVFVIACKKTDAPSASTPTPPAANGLPTLHTNDVSNLTYYSVNLSGKLLDSAGSKISETGIVIDTLPAPTISTNLNKFVLQRSNDGTFTTNVSGLPSNTTLYFRAYAINAKGTGYGNEIKFTTRQARVYKGDITLSTQPQVNDFGANHYTTIDGTLTVSGSVSDLTPLIGLTVLNHGLVVNYSSIKNFAGLDSLEEIGAVLPNDFWVQNNNNLIDFSGLSKLKLSRGIVQINNNNSLVSLDGLDSYIAASAGEMRIGENNKLQNLNGLKKMFFVGDNLLIINNPALTDITGLRSLSQVYSRLSIINNASLTNLNGLENIQTLPDGVEISGNSTLSDISGLRNLKLINGSTGVGTITLTNNPSITDLSAFSNITSVDYVTLINNSHLKDLRGLSNLQSINQLLHIENNAALTDLSGLEKLASLSRLEIFDNPSLINLKGLNGLTKIFNNPYSLMVARNNALVSLTGLENLARADGSVQIFSNTALVEFCALKNLFTKGYSQWFTATYNAANPTQNEVVANCH